MGIFDSFVYGYVVDTSWIGTGFYDVWVARMVTLFVLGTIWFIFLNLLYWIAEQLSFSFLPRYAKMNTIEKTDWTSRIVAAFMIGSSIYFSILLKLEGDDAVLESKTGIYGTYEETEYVLHKQSNPGVIYALYHAYTMFLGYEMYDLKNCINLKMTSGVIHHAVLIIMFPIGWSGSHLSVPAVYMTTLSYCSNLPAHVRSFMLHTGYRDTALYRYNKWAWWVAYIVCRLFGIPWYSANIYFCFDAALAQIPLGSLLWFFSAMVIHYILSLYWFVNMTRTMFPPKDYDLKRVESFGALPKAKEVGGQKFD